VTTLDSDVTLGYHGRLSAILHSVVWCDVMRYKDRNYVGWYRISTMSVTLVPSKAKWLDGASVLDVHVKRQTA
jgi:hypothetical protein